MAASSAKLEYVLHMNDPGGEIFPDFPLKLSELMGISSTLQFWHNIK